MQNILLIAAGGALGATGRHLMGQFAMRQFGPDWPWGTLIVNVAGGLAMGLLVGWLAAAERADATMLRFALGVGLLGGFTTFSAFSLEVVLMVERNTWGAAAAYVSVSVIGAVAAVFAGLFIARTAFA